jgi:RNA polymerase sigma-70 factor (ECF subfamily)
MRVLGDREERFREIYEAHYRHIGAYARRRAGDGDAEDVVAETFLVAWRRLDAIPQGDLTLAWLYGVARRVLSQRQRSGHRRDRLIARLGGLGKSGVTNVDDVERIDEQEVVRGALATLREADQEILRLSEWEELTASEIAVVLDCSTNAVAIRLHRAHKRLDTALRSVESRTDPDTEQEQQP